MAKSLKVLVIFNRCFVDSVCTPGLVIYNTPTHWPIVLAMYMQGRRASTHGLVSLRFLLLSLSTLSKSLNNRIAILRPSRSGALACVCLKIARSPKSVVSLVRVCREPLSREALWDVASKAAATPHAPRNESAEDATASVDPTNQQVYKKSCCLLIHQ